MAAFGLERGEAPVGCVAVYDRKIVAKGCNEVNISKNATRHAEMVVMDGILQFSSQKALLFSKVCRDSVLFVTVEPCIMCASALDLLGLCTVVYGCSNYHFGGCGSLLELDDNSRVYVKSGVGKQQSIGLLQKFYEGNKH